jgi:phage-related minor tail protein
MRYATKFQQHYTMENLKNIEPATPESVWAILQETAAQLKQFRAEREQWQAEFEQRQKEIHAKHEQWLTEFSAQQEKFQAKHEQRLAEFLAQQQKHQTKYEQRIAEYVAQRKKDEEKYAALQKPYEIGDTVYSDEDDECPCIVTKINDDGTVDIRQFEAHESFAVPQSEISRYPRYLDYI